MPDEPDRCIHCNKILRNPPSCCYTAINDYEEFFGYNDNKLLEEEIKRREALHKDWKIDDK